MYLTETKNVLDKLSSLIFLHKLTNYRNLTAQTMALFLQVS